MQIGVSSRSAGRLILAAAFVVAGSAFAWYFSQGTTTAHYDAKAHMVVARRVVDSPHPGYEQLGSHWLPLPHLLYLPFVGFDEQYRSAFLPSLLSVIAFALSVWLVFRIAERAFNNTPAGVFAAVVLLANPNLQYLASCPLTEPLFMVFMLAGVDRILAWRLGGGGGVPWRAAVFCALAALCRYEGWYVLAGVFALVLFDAGTGRSSRRDAVRALLTFGLLFAVPVAAHFGYLWVRTRDSFFLRVVEGAAVPFESYKRPLLSIGYHLEELAQIATVVPLVAGLTGTVLLLARWRRAVALLPIYLLWIPSLINISALYWGMIYRVRYSVILLPAIAIFASYLVTSATAARRILTVLTLLCLSLPWLPALLPQDYKYHLIHRGPGILVLPAAAVLLFLTARARARNTWALAVLCALAAQMPVLRGEDRAIKVETFEHDFLESQSQAVLALLKQEYDGTPILIDIAKSAPLLYDTGIPIRNFITNEVDLAPWRKAMQDPASAAGWICAMMGDDLWARLQVDPAWTRGYSLALQTEYFRIYRIKPEKRAALPHMGRVR